MFNAPFEPQTDGTDGRISTETCDAVWEENDRWYQNLTDDIIRTAGHLNAMESRFIELISEYDEYGLWRIHCQQHKAGQAIKNFANWLNVNCGIHPLVAREKIRVARHLRNLPEVADAFRSARISYSKVRALTRVATPENESMLLEDALAMTAAQLEQRVRRFRKVEAPDPYHNPEDGEPEQKPYAKCWRDDDGQFHLHARLPAEEGALVENAIERMCAKGGSEETDPLPASYVQEDVKQGLAQDDALQSGNESATCVGSTSKNVSAETFFSGRRARALIGIAEHFLATAKDGAECLKGSDKSHVVVHVNANDAHRDCKINKGACTFVDKGEFLAPEVAKRLACDAAITTVVEDGEGNVLNIGRRSRILTRAIEIAVDTRDNFTCQHPWCHQTRHTQKHHIQSWADGGETRVNNLITLCQRHHTLQHEGDFAIQRIEHDDGTYHFEFIDRHGETIQRGADPQFPGYSPGDPSVSEQVVPAAERDTCVIINRELSSFERRVERHRKECEALRLLYSNHTRPLSPIAT